MTRECARCARPLIGRRRDGVHVLVCTDCDITQPVEPGRFDPADYLTEARSQVERARTRKGRR